MTTDPNPGRPSMTEAEAAAEAQRLLADWSAPTAPTSYRDTTPTPTTGTTAPVAQPETRVVPPWATGIAVASIGIGAGATGLGCAAWLVLQGLSSITVAGVLAILAPFAGVALAALGIGIAVSRAKASTSTHIYEGQVIKSTTVTNESRGLLSRARTELHD
ncbi:hypothetical protein ACJ6WD_40540 [Streptomyces sp. VTCC 41912]|uniref:hypothetical protein n=1 Tax=Streptomyces sp. VTCC 41912 TaxID=3383243 RepID=UPI0038969797